MRKMPVAVRLIPCPGVPSVLFSRADRNLINACPPVSPEGGWSSLGNPDTVTPPVVYQRHPR